MIDVCGQFLQDQNTLQLEQQDTSVDSSQLQSVDEAAQPQYTSFGVEAFPNLLDAHTQAAIVPLVANFGRNKLMLSYCSINIVIGAQAAPSVCCRSTV